MKENRPSRKSQTVVVHRNKMIQNKETTMDSNSTMPSHETLIHPTGDTFHHPVTISTIAKGGVATPFPYRLHIMLDTMDTEAAKGNTRGKSIVGWQPHGRAFKVHDVKKFVDTIMPHFFKHTKYASFQRQLNLYGFMRLTVGPDKGACYHTCFVRNQPQLIQGMVRKRIKGTKIRKAVLPECQPNFYADEKLRVIAAVDAAFDHVAQEKTKNKPSMVQSSATKVVVPTEPVRPIQKDVFTIKQESQPMFKPIEFKETSPLFQPLKKESPLLKPMEKLIHPLKNEPFSLMVHFNHNTDTTDFSLF